MIYTYMSNFFTLTQGQCKYLSCTLTQPCVNVLGSVSVNTKIICEVVFGPPFTPNPSLRGFHKVSKFIRFENEMPKIIMHKVEDKL